MKARLFSQVTLLLLVAVSAVTKADSVPLIAKGASYAVFAVDNDPVFTFTEDRIDLYLGAEDASVPSELLRFLDRVKKARAIVMSEEFRMLHECGFDATSLSWLLKDGVARAKCVKEVVAQSQRRGMSLNSAIIAALNSSHYSIRIPPADRYMALSNAYLERASAEMQSSHVQSLGTAYGRMAELLASSPYETDPGSPVGVRMKLAADQSGLDFFLRLVQSSAIEHARVAQRFIDATRCYSDAARSGRL